MISLARFSIRRPKVSLAAWLVVAVVLSVIGGVADAYPGGVVSGAEGTSAVRTGLRETGAAATGAGLVMVAALIPFLTTSFVNVQQFGIGVAVAVLLDVLIVRPVLLPAAEIVLGPLGWWPTSGPTPAGPAPVSAVRRHPPRLHLRHRRPRTAHE